MSHVAPKVKICGLTSLGDAEQAASLGAWALGMVFYEHSPRQCSLAQAREISAALRRERELCGVFVNAPIDRVVDLAGELELGIVQLHGDEGPSYCAEVVRRTGAKLCKAMAIGAEGDVRSLERFHVDYHLLDARPPPKASATIRGGTGRTFDWNLVARRRARSPLILSGGLHAGNVVSAIEATRPFAVDTASGTESAPGRKDPDRMKAFFEAVAHAVVEPAA
jgi:phosphoribosylanthranilate isomerase